MMRVSRWVALGTCAILAACGGAIAPVGGNGDGGGSSSGSGGGSNGGSGSSASGSSSGFTGSGSGSGGSGGSTSGSNSSSGAVVDAAFACANGAPPPMTFSAVCDQCIEGSCGDTWCTCAADSPIDDAGFPDDAGSPEGCLGFVNCIIACLNGAPDAAPSPDASIMQCAAWCATPSYTQQQQMEGAALLGCLAANCNTPVTCGQ